MGGGGVVPNGPAHTIHLALTEEEVVSSSVYHWPQSVPLAALLLVNNAVHGPGHLRVKGPDGNRTAFSDKKGKVHILKL
jgi:hypothetical protein